MTNPKRYLVTSALPYANGLKHVGHLAGAYIPADIYVRYLRAQKRDVVFVCGSDEHGTAIPIQATKEGTTVRALVEQGLRNVLAERKQKQPFRLRKVVVHGKGLHSEARTLTWDQIRDRSYEGRGD